jgi:hypothetical protein
MPNAFILNRRCNTYAAALSAGVEMLVAAGWSYKASGDGLSGYSATGKIFTGIGSGALGWSNSRAWARLTDPSGRREITVQISPAGGAARFKVSASAKFTGGSPSATVTPSATDERLLFGTGTDAAPGFVAYWDGNMLTNDLYIFQGAAFAAPPYGFWWGGQGLPNGTKTGFLMMDPVLAPASDPDPVVWHVAANFACLVSTSDIGRDGASAATWTVTPGSVQGCFAHMDAAASAAGFVYVQPASYALGTAGHTLAPIGAGNNYEGYNPFDRDLDALPVLYARQRAASTTLPWGVKGWSSLTMWTGMARQSFFDTLDDKKWICFGHLWLRWDGLTNPVGC